MWWGLFSVFGLNSNTLVHPELHIVVEIERDDVPELHLFLAVHHVLVVHECSIRFSRLELTDGNHNTSIPATSG